MDTNFSVWFRKLRIKRGLTQREAAKALEVTGTTVCRWELGCEPRSCHLRRIQRWAQVEPGRLLDLLSAA